MMTKKKITLLCLLVAMVALLAAFTSCGGGGVTDIYVAKGDMPKNVYVEGQELDISGAALTVVVGDEPGIIPLDSEDVTITGYEKNKVGKQTLTITYEEFTTTIDVTVIPRMAPDGFESNYFVNEEFDKTKGKIKIARDDTSTFTVQMSDPGVEIVSFDSSEAGAVSVSVKYVDSKGSTYNGSFTVNVHEIGEISFHSPNKKNYESHDTELNLLGGYLTVKAAGSSSFEKKVPLTSENVKVSGFDPTVSNMENRDEPQPQKITVEFSGDSYTFDIKIYFSDISLTKEIAKQLTSINWNVEKLDDVVISDEQGQLAIEGVLAFFGLSPADQTSLGDENVTALLRAAALYVNKAYVKELEDIGDAVALSAQGMIIVGESYSAVKNAMERLEDSDDVINSYAVILRQLKTDYGDTAFMQGATLSDFIMVHTLDAADFINKTLSHMLETYDYIAEIPNDWTAESLSAYSEDIEDLVRHVVYGDYNGINYFNYYKIVSSWRESGDVYELSKIVYSYYLYTVETVDNNKIYEFWDDIPMPDAMEDWYLAMYNSVYFEQLMSSNIDNPQALLYDTTYFMYYCDELSEAAALVKSSGSQLCKDLYAQLACDEQAEMYVRKGTCGYLYHMSFSLGVAGVENVWDKYLEIIDLYSTNLDINQDEFNEDVEELFAAIVELSPAELNGFLTSLHFHYDTVYGNAYVLDCRNGSLSVLTTLLKSRFTTDMTEGACAVFYDLLVAMEKCSLYYVSATDNKEFTTAMKKVVDAYEALPTVDKASFNKYMKACYEKYAAIYETYVNDSATATDEQTALIEQFLATVGKFDELFQYITTPNEDATEEESRRVNAAFPVVFALYAKANSLYSTLKSDESLAYLLVAKEYEFSEVEITVERLYYNARAMFMGIMLNASLPDEDGNRRLAWDLYTASGLDSFFAKSADLMLAGLDGEVYTADDVDDIIAMFKALDAVAVTTFFEFGAHNTYYDGLELYLNSKLPESVTDKEIVEAVLNAQIYAAILKTDASEENVEEFKKYMQTAKEKYEAIENKTDLPAELVALYNESLEASEGLITE